MEPTIREWPAMERPRERLRSAGAQALSTRELLALLVGSGGEGRSAVRIAEELLAEAQGSLRRLAGRDVAELERTPGIGPAVAGRIAAALELGRRLAREGPAERARVSQPADVYDRCAPLMRDLGHEEFRVLLLSTTHAITSELVITRGVLDGSLVHPREVFRGAIQERAHGIVLVHNHPSGDPAPSPEDRSITRQLADAGRVVGIAVIDHVIIGDGRYFSFVEAGLLEAV